jgi:hypothetical protein
MCLLVRKQNFLLFSHDFTYLLSTGPELGAIKFQQDPMEDKKVRLLWVNFSSL